MDNIRFGQFIAELRKELGMTQKELAAKLNVTDKAVSKWETGKGFPDIKLMEDLARALDITLVELIRCQKQEVEQLTVAEANEVVSQAMDQGQKVTARRYLRLLRWLLAAIGLMTAYTPVLNLVSIFIIWMLTKGPASGADMGIIGGADGPTVMLVSRVPGNTLFINLLLFAIAVLCLFLILRVRKVEKNLK